MLNTVHLTDYHPDTMGWYDDVLTGLQKPYKTLPPKLFYDERGSQLFDAITELPEYYPMRTEQAIMDARVGEIAALFGEDVLLVEYGSGSSQKTRTLLSHLQLAGYVPIDISRDYLWETAVSLSIAYPDLQIMPVAAPSFGQQKVLRGGCWVTRSRVIRNTWRNFYTPDRNNIYAGFRTVAR
ncbi:MAG: hypothetical protein DWQ04_24955 [Chloroflexi bacterium]|nr:MAG: hypothetical protein DWQ04_24955 [Chloroflexota bacterium]